METHTFDELDFLKNDEEVFLYFQECLKEGNSELIAYALGVVSRYYGMKKTAEKTGLSRESLYRSLSKNGNPRLSTFISVLNANGYRLSVEQIK